MIISTRIPTPNIDGASLRICNLLKLLIELSYKVTFTSSFPSSWEPFCETLEKDIEYLENLGVDVESSSVKEHLEKKGSEYDIIILNTNYSATHHLKYVKEYAPKATTIFDTVSLQHLRFFREAKTTGNSKILLRSLQAKKQEISNVELADYTFTVSEYEKNILKQESPDSNIHIISNIHDIYGSSKDYSNREGIIFIGSFQHNPNLDAVSYLVNEIYPLIKKEMKDVKIYIIGDNPPDFIKELNSENIIITGYVNNLDEYYNKCRISIVPLRFGSGVKSKVLLSMGYGVPVVATSIGTEGLLLRNKENVMEADTAKDFSKAVLELYNNSDLWNKVSRNGFKIIENHFSFESVKNKLMALLGEMQKGI